MRYIVLVSVVIINLIFSAAVFPNLNIADLAPDLIVCSMASIVILEKRMTGAVIGFSAGLILDLFLSGAIGFYALPYLLTGAVLYAAVRQIAFIDRILIPAAIAAGAYLLRELISALLAYMLGHEFSLWHMLVRYILPEMLITAAVMIPVHLLLSRIYRSPSVRPQNPDEFKRL